MEIFVNNILWMGFNSMLAFIGMFLGLLMLKTPNKIAQIGIGVFWLLFIPNTIYMVTDLAHLSWQIPRVTLGWQIGIIIQFVALALLGIMTFILGVHPFEKVLGQTKKFRQKHIFVLTFVVLNLALGFGVMLGRVYRIHSWYVFTQPRRVIVSTLDLLSSFELTIIALAIGVIGFVVYFLLRDTILSVVSKKITRF